MIARLRKIIGLGILGLLVLLVVGGGISRSNLLRAPLARAAGPVGMVCTDGVLIGSTRTFNLQTATGFISTPDGNSLFMWGYTTNPGSFQMPGPVLCAREGETVVVNLSNTLVEATSIIFAGQANVAASGDALGLLAYEAAAGGGSSSYSFLASQPGTYIYNSGTNIDKQVQMGMYGALVIRPLMGDDYAYNDASTRFEREFLILLHEIDPDIHRAVELGGLPFDFNAIHDRYWTVNGRSMPDTLAPNGVTWLPNQPYGALVQVEASSDANDLPVLVRYANAGMFNHPFHPHGNHLRVIARDGRLLRGPGGEDASMEAFTKTIGAGQTYDLLFRWINTDAWSPSGNPIPVQVPGLQNLVFMDDATFYSGDPYLGQNGELPVGVTSYNQCGEFYYPWHTHALDNFQNFDEGFGGLATAVRVDPPGGCP